MKERDATAGDKLCAIVMAITLRETFRTALGRMDEHANKSWDDLARIIQKNSIDGLWLPPSNALEADSKVMARRRRRGRQA